LENVVEKIEKLAEALNGNGKINKYYTTKILKL